MLSDPYLDVIRKTKNLNLDETQIENAINFFLKNGGDQSFHHLVTEKKIPEEEAWKLVKVIRKEFRATYYSGALYSGIFMALWLFLAYVIYSANGYINFISGFFFVLFLFCFYFFVRKLIKAFSIK